MARKREGVELGFNIFEENSNNFVGWLAKSTAPVGTGDEASAPIGSIFQRIGTGELYLKKTNVGNASDWVVLATGSTVTRWRPELVDVLTNDTQGAGTRDVVASPFSDDDGPLTPADFIIGHYIVSDADGTPTLLEITNKSGVGDKDITFAVATSLVDGDALIASKYLPDEAGGENKAMVVFSSGVMVKLSDIDWEFATGIKLSGGFSKVNGTVTGADTVESAIEKLAKNQEDLTTLSGNSQGSTDHGTFTGSIIPNSSTTKGALQSLETDAELEKTKIANLVTLSGRPVNSTDNGTMDAGDILSDNATTNALLKETDAELTRQRGKSSATGITGSPTVIDSVLVDDVANVQWNVTVEENGTPANKKHFSVFAGHNGSASGVTDATAVDESVSKILKQGSNFDIQISVTISGTGAGQIMNLVIDSTDTVDVYAKRVETLY